MSRNQAVSASPDPADRLKRRDPFGSRVRTALGSASAVALVAFALVSLVVAYPAVPAHAASIAVTTTADAVAGDGLCSLREAVRAANTDAVMDACPAGSGNDTVVVPAGTYVLTVVGASENASATGDLDLTSNVVIQGAGSGSTFIDGNHTDRVFHILAGSVAINDLTVQNGNAVGTDSGGGIAQDGGVGTLNRLVVVGNTAAFNSGGIDVCGGTSLTVNDSVIALNTAPVGGGSTGRGGGIGICDSGHLFLNSSVVRSNTAASHGGGLAQHVSPSTVTIRNSTITANISGTVGGGIESFSTLTIDSSAISNNYSAGETGGGVIHTAGTFTLTNSTVSGNTTNGGGGALDLAASGGVGVLNAVTITNNTADLDGDGPEPSGFASSLGGGILNRGVAGAVTVRNSIVAGNHRHTSNAECSSFVTSLGGNVFGNSDCAAANVADVVAAPNLVALAANAPGTTPTHALCSGVAAPDASCGGASPALGFAATACLAVDQRGVARPQGDTPNCDSGAFESPLSIAPLPTACPAGSFSATGNTPCTLAPAGSFAAGSGSTSATPCLPGTFSDVMGAAACMPAPAGSFVAVGGSSSATLCPAGTFTTAAGAVGCTSAPAGSFVAVGGSSSATPCLPGTFSSAAGAVGCMPAPAGSFAAGSSNTASTPCPAGTFSSAAGAVGCTSAPPGSFAAGSGNTASTPCAAGTFSPAAGAVACTPAPIGSYAPGTGNTAAILCPVGTTTGGTGSTSCNQAALTVVSPSSGVYLDRLPIVVAGGSGTGAVTFDAGASTACAIGSGLDAGKVIITHGTGSCSITATKAADAVFRSATTPPLGVTVAKLAQTITFSGVPASAPMASNFTPVAAATSGFPTVITVSGPCSFSLGVVTITSFSGTCVVKATQVGNVDYSSALATVSVLAVPRTPVTVDDCKRDGWKQLARADGRRFRNQGDCVSYVNHLLDHGDHDDD